METLPQQHERRGEGKEPTKAHDPPYHMHQRDTDGSRTILSEKLSLREVIILVGMVVSVTGWGLTIRNDTQALASRMNVVEDSLNGFLIDYKALSENMAMRSDVRALSQAVQVIFRNQLLTCTKLGIVCENPPVLP